MVIPPLADFIGLYYLKFPANAIVFRIVSQSAPKTKSQPSAAVVILEGAVAACACDHVELNEMAGAMNHNEKALKGCLLPKSWTIGDSPVLLLRQTDFS